MTNSEKYLSAFQEVFHVDADTAAGMQRQDMGEWDSVGHMGLISALEEAFGITMDTQGILAFTSFEKGREILAADHGIVF